MSRRITDLAHELQRVFRWHPTSASFTVVKTWDSRTASLVHLRSTDKPEREIVLKVLPDWKADELRAAYNMLALRRRILSGRDASVARGIQPLGWLPEPPLLCAEYVPGHDLSTAIMRLESSPDQPLETAVAACGRALGYLHAATTSDDGDRSGSDLHHLARRVGLRRAAERVELRDVRPLTVTSAGDFAAYNIRRGDDGRVTLIDVSRHQTRLRPHRDIAWFLYSLGSCTRAPDRLEQIFQSAYCETGPVDLGAPAESLAVSLYLAQRYYAMAIAHLRKGQVASAARRLRSLRSHRRRVALRPL